jgi:hypothetical protein
MMPCSHQNAESIAPLQHDAFDVAIGSIAPSVTVALDRIVDAGETAEFLLSDGQVKRPPSLPASAGSQLGAVLTIVELDEMRPALLGLPWHPGLPGHDQTQRGRPRQLGRNHKAIKSQYGDQGPGLPGRVKAGQGRSLVVQLPVGTIGNQRIDKRIAGRGCASEPAPGQHPAIDQWHVDNKWTKAGPVSTLNRVAGHIPQVGNRFSGPHHLHAEAAQPRRNGRTTIALQRRQCRAMTEQFASLPGAIDTGYTADRGIEL